MIAIVQGGSNSEAAVSRSSSKAVQEAMQKLGYEFKVFEADENLYNNLRSEKFRCCFIALHGQKGEDGVIQGLCEYIGLPYTGSGLLASALAFNKQKSKEIFRQCDIPVMESFVVTRAGQTTAPKPSRYPVIIKPNRDGSSVGVMKCSTHEEYSKNLQEALKQNSDVIVEDFIQGEDFTVGVFDGKALEPILIRPKEGFYDYTNKYTAGKTDYLIPAPVPEELKQKCKAWSETIFKKMDLKVYARVDFMCTAEGEAYALEVNTLPGLTPTSLLPKAAKYEGYEFSDIIKLLVERATLDYENP
ncbi:MAG: D-alanine--D-alanine ligase [Bdellovibrionaceae bacterium]|nr:D-alanine--D-alanine ligase [Pseudobdellovibrionaceae bacterium]